MTLEQMNAIIAHAPPDASLPYQVMQVRQGLANGEKKLMRVEVALEQLAQHLDPGHRNG
jgi:hypothetical protein